MRVIKSGMIIIAGAFLAEALSPGCAPHDWVCHTLAEPPHTNQEVPADSNRVVVTRAIAQGSNTSAQTIKINVGDSARHMRDSVIAEFSNDESFDASWDSPGNA